MSRPARFSIPSVFVSTVLTGRLVLKFPLPAWMLLSKPSFIKPSKLDEGMDLICIQKSILLQMAPLSIGLV